MAFALPKETEEVVNRCARLAEAGRRLDGVQVESVLTGRPAGPIDLIKMEGLLSDPHITVREVARLLGTHRNTFYNRRQSDPQFREVYDRAMRKRREGVVQATMSRPAAVPGMHRKAPARSALELLITRLPDFNPAWTPEVQAKWFDAYLRLCDEAAA